MAGSLTRKAGSASIKGIKPPLSLIYCPFLNVFSQMVLTDPNLSFRSGSRSHCLFWLIPTPNPPDQPALFPVMCVQTPRTPTLDTNSVYLLMPVFPPGLWGPRGQRPSPSRSSGQLECLVSSGNAAWRSESPEESFLLPHFPKESVSIILSW